VPPLRSDTLGWSEFGSRAQDEDGALFWLAAGIAANIMVTPAASKKRGMLIAGSAYWLPLSC
jgi:hypothetical protein